MVPVAGGAPKDLTPGDRDVPPFSLGGADDYAVSPDGTEVCYAMNADPVPAISTNSDLYVVSIEGGEAAQDHHQSRARTTGPRIRPTASTSPSARRPAPGYESDRWRLMVLERATGKVTSLTEGLDRWVTGFAWSPDSARLFFTAEDRGRQAIQFIPVTRRRDRASPRAATATWTTCSSPPTARPWSTRGQSGSQPVEIYPRLLGRRASAPLTRLNDAVLNSYQLAAARGVLGGGRGRRARPRLPGEAARLPEGRSTRCCS